MLATNESTYKKIVETDPNAQSIVGEGSSYKQQYDRHIIFDIMNNKDESRSQTVVPIQTDKEDNLWKAKHTYKKELFERVSTRITDDLK